MPTSQTIEQGVTASFSPGLITTIIEAPTEEVFVFSFVFLSNILNWFCQIHELVMVAKDRQVSYLTSQGSEANPGLPVILR